MPEVLTHGSWLTPALLGAFHGLNPAMGWLFAVFLALQRQRQRALWLALVPITLGHGAAVAGVAGLVVLARSTLPLEPVRWGTAGLLLIWGLARLWRGLRGPRWVGLNVGYGDLAWWSLLMATAHGSGLMLAPLVLGLTTADTALGLVAVHSLAMLGVMAVVAWLVYARLGVVILRRFWVNVDLLWALALCGAGGLSLGGLALGPAH